VRQVCTVLRAALDDAVLDGLLARNPAALVKRPGVERTEARHLGADTVASVLRAAEGLRYRPVLVLIAATGLRRGEALGLAWRHVNLRRHAALHRDCRREGWRRRHRGPHPAAQCHRGVT
jgi:integrase